LGEDAAKRIIRDFRVNHQYPKALTAAQGKRQWRARGIQVPQHIIVSWQTPMIELVAGRHSMPGHQSEFRSKI
jgi:D-alanyl-D-alanine carboxypeptidase